MPVSVKMNSRRRRMSNPDSSSRDITAEWIFLSDSSPLVSQTSNHVAGHASKRPSIGRYVYGFCVSKVRSCSSRLVSCHAHRLRPNPTLPHHLLPPRVIRKKSKHKAERRKPPIRYKQKNVVVKSSKLIIHPERSPRAALLQPIQQGLKPVLHCATGHPTRRARKTFSARADLWSYTAHTAKSSRLMEQLALRQCLGHIRPRHVSLRRRGIFKLA